MASAHPAPIEVILGELAPQVLGALMRRFGDISVCEDAVQEALLAGARQWPAQGQPEHPRAWLTQVAIRRLIDHQRSEIARRKREYAWSQPVFMDNESLPEIPQRKHRDDSLILLFMCCHPSLNPSAAIALTLRAVGGLSPAEIAQAFLIPEATMAQRISRAKQKIKESGIPFALPRKAERRQRLSSVLRVLYLMFNEGYASSHGAELQRGDLANESLRLTRELHHRLPQEPEVGGLLALMLLTHARRLARTGPHGELIPLDSQDRKLWDSASIQEGIDLLNETLPQGSVGPYQIQAAIAAIHDEAPDTQTTDWIQIEMLYRLLKRMSDNPMVSLNHAIAVAMVHGPSAGLELLAALDRDRHLADHHRLLAVRAHLNEKAGHIELAIEQYQAAARLTQSLPERDYLILQASRLRNRHPTPD